MRFLVSPARRSILRVTGVLVAVVVATAGLSAFTFAARPAAARPVSGQAVPGGPPAGL